MAPRPSDERKHLWAACEAFIAEQQITCPETIYQADRVILNAYEFIERVCEIVGYAAPADDMEEDE